MLGVNLQAVEKLGGIKAIVISHPHFYSAMCAWSLRFGAPVYVHEVVPVAALYSVPSQSRMHAGDDICGSMEACRPLHLCLADLVLLQST
jgi:glyoxylase-like metal-dependent hydrolase (beta-lactamase superfamily II)